MSAYEDAKRNADTARDALTALAGVRDKMLDLVIAGKLTSEDFATLNALDKQLNGIYDRLNSDQAFGNLMIDLREIDLSKIV